METWLNKLKEESTNFIKIVVREFCESTRNYIIMADLGLTREEDFENKKRPVRNDVFKFRIYSEHLPSSIVQIGKSLSSTLFNCTNCRLCARSKVQTGTAQLAQMKNTFRFQPPFSLQLASRDNRHSLSLTAPQTLQPRW